MSWSLTSNWSAQNASCNLIGRIHSTTIVGTMEKYSAQAQLENMKLTPFWLSTRDDTEDY